MTFLYFTHPLCGAIIDKGKQIIRSEGYIFTVFYDFLYQLPYPQKWVSSITAPQTNGHSEQNHRPPDIIDMAVLIHWNFALLSSSYSISLNAAWESQNALQVPTQHSVQEPLCGSWNRMIRWTPYDTSAKFLYQYIPSVAELCFS